METEFNLSDKIFEGELYDLDYIYVKDVEEFIKRLKKELPTNQMIADGDLDIIIDKLAGHRFKEEEIE